jgi:hypothetical protein
LRWVHFASIHIMIPSPPRKRNPGISIKRIICLSLAADSTAVALWVCQAATFFPIGGGHNF